MPSIPADFLSTYASLEPGSTDARLPENEQDWEARRRKLEHIPAIGNWIFRAISVVDQNWHIEVYEGRTEYNVEEEKIIFQHYSAWLQPTQNILAQISQIEARGETVDGSEEFRRNHSEARGVLADDVAFFSDDALIELRDQAIDAHQEGRTADI